MTRSNQILAALFVVQLLLAAGIEIGNRPPAAVDMQSALLDVDQKRISRIVLDDGKSGKVTLSKVDGHWQLPNYYKLPASQSVVDNILTTLAKTRSGWPVATTAAGIKRFEVSDDNYQTRITLANDDKTLETLYLGTSPGFRQLHLRRDGEDKVYTVKLNSYDFPLKNEHWLDRSLLQPQGDIAELQGPDFTVDRQGEAWKLAGDTGEVQQAEIEKLVNAVSHLDVQAAADKTAGDKGYTLMIKTADSNIRYNFFSAGGDYYVRRDGYDQSFKISKGDYEKITGETATQLVKHVGSEKTDGKQHASYNLKGQKPPQQNG